MVISWRLITGLWMSVLQNIGGLWHVVTNVTFISMLKGYCLHLCYRIGSWPSHSWWRSSVCPRDSGTAEPGSESPTWAPRSPEEVVPAPTQIRWHSSQTGTWGGNQTVHFGFQELSRPGQCWYQLTEPQHTGEQGEKKKCIGLTQNVVFHLCVVIIRGMLWGQRMPRY